MDLVWIVQALLAVLVTLIGFLYKELKGKVDRNLEEFLNYKTRVSEIYATQPQLTHAIESVNRTVDTIAAGVSRIEERLYKHQERNE